MLGLPGALASFARVLKRGTPACWAPCLFPRSFGPDGTTILAAGTDGIALGEPERGLSWSMLPKRSACAESFS